jgi:hypothetical protein
MLSFITRKASFFAGSLESETFAFTGARAFLSQSHRPSPEPVAAATRGCPNPSRGCTSDASTSSTTNDDALVQLLLLEESI